MNGLRVLDLADDSGAFAGKLLAALGADVVVVEPPGGHPGRRRAPRWAGAPAGDDSVFFWFYAAGKRSIALDPESAEARRILARLADAADVVVSTGAPGSAADWLAERPRLVVAAITPMGQAGPRREWLASDTVAQAAGGMLGASGPPEGPPLRSLGLQAYHQAGVFASIGVLAALLAREASGCGQLVDVSLQAAVAASLEHVPGLFHQDGTVVRRTGALHWSRFFRVGPCRDGFVLHCTLGDWTSLFEWMKADGMAAGLDDPALEDPAVRQARADEVFDALDAWAVRYTAEELAAGAQLRRLAYAAVRPPEALLHDAQLAARGFFVPLDHPALAAPVPFPGPPFRLGELPPRYARPPRLDEDRRAILRDWLGEP